MCQILGAYLSCANIESLSTIEFIQKGRISIPRGSNLLSPPLARNDVVVPTIRVLNGQEQRPSGIQQINFGKISTDQGPYLKSYCRHKYDVTGNCCCGTRPLCRAY